tara:strand:- start:1471 stop:3339 length:1869 start_codon:yes stop_codon:yes gene_type:complete
MIVITYLYPISLAIISAFVATLEYLFPWRKEQKQLREALFSDFLHLIFNGHFLGIIIFGISTLYVLPYVDQWLAAYNLTGVVYRNAAASWPLWVQIIVALVVVDFVQWCVHNLLHRVPFFWDFHKCHHSVKDGEMDWIVSFRFQWTEVVVYKTVLYFPLAFFGFSQYAILFHAIFGTLIGHLNHANLDLGYGWWKYIFNSPRMHIWHHDYDGDSRTTVNFGIIFSTWDWIFGTAKMPDDPPKKLGFHGVEEFPEEFFGHAAWPLQMVLPHTKTMAVIGGVFGFAVLGAGWYFAQPKKVAFLTPMMGEQVASSMPAVTPAKKSAYSSSPEEATKAISAFGTAAKATGYRFPEWMVSVSEVAKALGSPKLILLDVRPKGRFELGHIPSARQLYRSDYSASKPIPGLSRKKDELQALLRKKGVNQDSVIVLYTDGGPEAFRLWWTLRKVTNTPTRILDGGLQQWKKEGHAIAGGKEIEHKAGDIKLDTPKKAPLLLWSQLKDRLGKEKHLLLDTRNTNEFTGKKHHRKAARAGHIPKSRLLVWHKVIRSEKDRRMKSPKELKELFASYDVKKHPLVVTYCQSGTRSAAVYFALAQMGIDESALLNYDGSWAEYSRLKELPIEKGK